MKLIFELDAPEGSVEAVKECVAMTLERFGDIRLVEVTETGPEQMRMKENSNAKIIEIHSNGVPLLVNLRHVELAAEEDGRSIITVHDVGLPVDEPYPKLRTIIASTQGGLPMEPTNPY